MNSFYLILIFLQLSLYRISSSKIPIDSCSPPCARIGLIYPNLVSKNDSSKYEMDHIGNQYLQAFKMAVDDINEKKYIKEFPSITISYVAYGVAIPFIDDINAAIDMNTVLGKNKNVSVHAMVASANNIASNAAAQIDNHFKMTQVAYGSTGSFLSYVGPYPYYVRTCPNDAFQGKILANLAFNKFNWLSVTTFNTLDTNGYGTDGVQQFILEATNLGITILSSHQFRPGENLNRVITEAKKFGARIFLIFMDTSDTAR